MLHQWAMVGAYDFLNIVEAPDAETMAKISRRARRAGQQRLQTFELSRSTTCSSSSPRSCSSSSPGTRESTLNFEHRVNGDPSVAVPLTEQGREEARLLGAQLAQRRARPLRALAVSAHDSRRRSSRSRAAASRSRSSRGSTTSTSATWRAGRSSATARSSARLGRKRPFPGGECLDDAARRYAAAFRDLRRARRRRECSSSATRFRCATR